MDSLDSIQVVGSLMNFRPFSCLFHTHCVWHTTVGPDSSMPDPMDMKSIIPGQVPKLLSVPFDSYPWGLAYYHRCRR
jgi:hypothetical protein